MKKVPISKSEHGFTLAEVLIALTIFAIGLLALASMQVTAMRGNTTSQRVTAATALAEGALEWLESLPTDSTVFDADVTGEPVDHPPFDANGIVTMDGGGTFTATYNIDTTPLQVGSGASAFPNGVIQIDVNVVSSFTGRSVQLTSLKWVR